MTSPASDRFLDDPLVSDNTDPETLARLEALWLTRLREASASLQEQLTTINELEAAIVTCNEDEKQILAEFENILEKPTDDQVSAAPAVRVKRTPTTPQRGAQITPSINPDSRTPHQAAILDILRPFLMLDRASDRTVDVRIPSFERAADPIHVPPIARPRGIDSAVFNRLLALRSRRIAADITRTRLKQRIVKAVAVRDERARVHGICVYAYTALRSRSFR